MAAFCSSCCGSRLPASPSSMPAGVVGRPYACRYDTWTGKKDTIFVASAAAKASKCLSSSMVASIGAALVLTASGCPAEAGLLSGAPGLQSFRLPALPSLENMKKMQEETKARYEDFDTKSKSSPLLQELLKRSKENAEKHKQEIQNKYCQRGADWGVGDCSVSALSEAQRAKFMEALKGSEAPQ